jgi:hypothetical protein
MRNWIWHLFFLGFLIVIINGQNNESTSNNILILGTGKTINIQSGSTKMLQLTINKKVG